MKRALIVVDPQYDFMPGGALPVPGGDEIVPVVNRLLAVPWSHVVISRDQHPSNHSSFKENGGDWPAHCVVGTRGARIHDVVSYHAPFTLACKGTEPGQEDYSAFGSIFNLDNLLRGLGITRVYVCGLATDYCVKATVLDALKAGYETYVVLDACRGLGGSERAIIEMLDAGALATTVGGVLR